MAGKRSDEQIELVGKAVLGIATKRELARLAENYREWLKRDWAGDEGRALAFCVEALSEAYEDSREWRTLNAEEGTAVLMHFVFLYLPTRDTRDDDAEEFRDEIRNNRRNLREFAQWAMKIHGR